MENTDSPRARIKLEGILPDDADADLRRGSDGAADRSAAARRPKTRRCWKTSALSPAVVEEVVQDYALFEVQRTEHAIPADARRVSRAGRSLSSSLMVGAIGFSVLAAWGISRSIYIPIKKLHDVTTTITKNDLQALVTHDNVDEITELGMSFNIMIGRIRELLDCQGQGTGEPEEGRAARAAGADQPAFPLQHAGHDHLDDRVQEDRPGDRDRQRVVEFLPDQPEQGQGLDHDRRRGRADPQLSDHSEDALSGHPGLPDRGG